MNPRFQEIQSLRITQYGLLTILQTCKYQNTPPYNIDIIHTKINHQRYQTEGPSPCSGSPRAEVGGKWQLLPIYRTNLVGVVLLLITTTDRKCQCDHSSLISTERLAMEILFDAGGSHALRQDNSLPYTLCQCLHVMVKVVNHTPRWTCHEIIAWAGVIPSSCAINFTWGDILQKDKDHLKLELKLTSGKLRLSPTCFELPRGEYASSSNPFSFDHWKYNQVIFSQ